MDHKLSSLPMPVSHVLAITTILLGTLLIVYVLRSAVPSFSAGEIPMLLGTYSAPGSSPANAVAVKGNYAYVVTNNNTSFSEFYILDVTNPSVPNFVGGVEIGSAVRDVYVKGNFAYLATKKENEEFIVINVSNKSAPTKVWSYDTPRSVSGLAVNGISSYVYLGTEKNGADNGREFYVFDMTASTSPQFKGAYEVSAHVNDIAVDGSRAYLVTSDGLRELIILDVSNPTLPVLASILNLPSNPARGVDVKSGKAYVVTDNNGTQPDLFVVDVSQPALPVILGSTNLGSTNNKIAVYRERAYVVTQDSREGLTIVNVSNPASPTQETTASTGDPSKSVATDGVYVYLLTTSGSREFQIFDPKTPLKPNIVVILTDDQRWDTLQYMPTVMEKLVNQGINFTNTFTTTALCCPSRASILTGQYAHNHGVKSNIAPDGGATIFNDSSTIVTWIHGVGYTTGFFGKYLNDYEIISPRIPPGWDQWYALLFKNSSSFLNGYTDYNANENGAIIPHTEYSTDYFAARAVDFIHTNADRPFLLQYNPFAPHLWSIAAPRHTTAFTNLSPWRPPNWKEPDMTDKPPWWQETLPPRWSTSSDSGVDAFRTAQLRTLLAVDEGVDSILSALDETGNRDNTIVIYTSDNSHTWGEHWWVEKRCAYEECIRVPLAMRYPALIRTPRTENKITANIDLAPTLAELAGASVPSTVDGRSLLSVMKNTENNWRSDILIEGWNLYNGPNILPLPTFGAVRSSDWKYVSSDDPSGPFEELYNLQSDPYELQNVASDVANTSILENMRTRLNQLLAE